MKTILLAILLVVTFSTTAGNKHESDYEKHQRQSNQREMVRQQQEQTRIMKDNRKDQQRIERENKQWKRENRCNCRCD